MVYLFLAVLLPLVTTITTKVVPYTHLNPGEDYNSVEYFECPDDNWVLGKFDDVVYCYRPYDYNDGHGASKTIQIIQDNYCTNAHKDAYIGNVHSHEEVEFLRNEFMTGIPERRDYGNTTKFIVGMYKTSGSSMSLLNFEPIDELSLTYLHFQNKQEKNHGNSIILDLEEQAFHYVFINDAIDKENASFLCKMEATRRPVYELMESNRTEGIDLQKYTCGDDSENWEIANVCGEVFCYNWVNDELVGVFANYPVDFNECGERFAGANFVSIHCKAEDEFIRRYGPNIIGLYRKFFNNQAKAKDLRWQDGSVMNYINLETKQNFDLYYHYPNALVQQQGPSYGWKLAEKDQKATRVCKRKAGLTNDDVFDEDWVPVPTKMIDGQECADFGRKLTSTQCPDNTWVKAQWGNDTYCYRRFEFDYSKEKEFLDHSICKELHKDSKAASIESVNEEDFIESYYPWSHLGVTSNDGGKTFVWADGTTFKPKVGSFIGDQNKPLSFKYGGRYQFNSDPPYPVDTCYNYGLCKMKALSINKCPKPIDNSVKKPSDYECPEGWIKFKACNQVSCYRTITLSEEKQRDASQIIADNVCSSELDEKDSDTHLASIHCEREDIFIRNKFGKVLLPLEYTGDDNGNPAWEWLDGSDFNYILAYGINETNNNVTIKITYVDKIVTTSVHGKTYWNAVDDGALEDTQILCKKSATLKNVPDLTY